LQINFLPRIFPVIKNGLIMTDLIEDIINFFEAQKRLYGKIRPLESMVDYRIPGLPTAQDGAATGNEVMPVVRDQTRPLLTFHREIKDCQRCALGMTRTHFVFGVGNPNADLMFVGEAPGRDEDLQGIPFVGRAGQLLTLMIQAIGLKREDVYIANVLKCRPPNNRDPLPAEIEKCEPYLLKQIELIAPKLIVALGRFACASLLKTTEALGSLREKIHSYNEVPLVVTYHPAALLRNPSLKKQTWDDLKRIYVYLNEN
jgi:DNA polymerase